jgi:hypothetical protein
VVLINNGEIRGLSNSKNALELTSALTLVNNGWIRGAGGNGGYGGKGGDDTYTKSSTETRYNFGCGSGNSLADHSYSDWVTITWSNKYCNVKTTGKGPVKHEDFSGSFYRGNYKCTATCDTTAKFYEIKRVTYSTHSRTGGAGGAGGKGIAFGQGQTYGSPGLPSTPTGGNSGGAGGTGGSWGVAGAPGSRGVNGEAGKLGEPAGYAITGTTYLMAGSNIGNISGETTSQPTADNNDNSVYELQDN